MSSSSAMFKRREGTAGISGHLYETKLISLLYFRALHEYTIEEFQLASNVDNIGTFDDICLKVKVEEFDKPISVFIQAKHKENTKQTLKIDLSTYFISYLKIRQHFDPNNKDLFFKGTFDETECLFIIYTTARDEFSNDSKVESSFFSILNDLIDTGGTAKQPYRQEEDAKSLCEVAMKEQMIYLAKRIAELIYNDGKFEMLLTDEILQRFHVILAQKVVDVSEIQPNGHRNASFRHDFFDTANEEYLTIFKDTLFNEILKKREIEPTNINGLLSEFLDEPTNATKLSKVIGTVVTYKKGFLEINEQFTEYFSPRLKQVFVSPPTVDEAVEMAAKQILLSLEFKCRVPSTFGNKDIKLSGNKERRITFLTTTITDLLKSCTSSNIVTIDNSLPKGFLQLNGGIASAIGNIFVLDDNTRLMKITENSESLGPLARQLHESLNAEIELINKDPSNNKISNLRDYRFSFKGKQFPKLLLECSEYEENLAKDFLNKLVFYSNQAKEKSVEEKLKKEIVENLTLSDSCQDKIDEIFLKYHKEIQTWWMKSKEVSYLTKNSQIFEKATSYIIEDPLISSISVPYVRKIKRYNYTFTEDAVRSLNLQDQQLSTIIVAENSILTIVKVMQHLKIKDYVALDIEQILSLTKKKRNALKRELTTTKKERILIFVCDKILDNGKEKKTLEILAEAVQNKKTIIITKDLSFEILQRYFNTADTVRDEKNSLIDMSEETQTRILKCARVKFQGMEVGLEDLVRGWSR